MITAWEKYGGTALSRLEINPVDSELPHEPADWAPEQNRSGSDSAGHSVAFAQPLVST